MIDFSSPEFYH